MKKLAYGLVGAILGSIVVFGVGFLLNSTLVNFDIRLYNSEDDQQRNFNIFLTLWAFCAVAGAFLGFKKAGAAQPRAQADAGTSRQRGLS